MKRSLAFLLIALFGTHLQVLAASKFPCANWLLMPAPQKAEFIQAVVSHAKEDGVKIHLPVSYYVQELDALIEHYRTTKNEKALASSLGVAFRTVAVMESDWDDGRDPIVVAKETMKGDFDSFTKLYPEKYQAMLKKSELMME